MHINTVAYLVEQYHAMSRSSPSGTGHPAPCADVSRVGGGAG